MNWTEIISDAIIYIESNITKELSTEKIAEYINVSPFYFQKGFSMLCDLSPAEYIRNRRLSIAGTEILAGNDKIIDIAMRYGYDSPDSFTKAFTRFHGLTPIQARKEGSTLKSFAPLKIKISLEGGYIMDYKIIRKEAFTVIANAKTFSYENAKENVPQFWQEHYKNGGGQTVMGMFGINIDESMGNDTFEYLIADICDPNRDVPDGFTLRTIPAFTWAVFPCKGPMPQSMQDANTLIYTEWLPALKEYEFAAGYCVEFYANPCDFPKGTLDENYYSEIWIPIKAK
ncbi:MAG: AraC family transcriptional regulator [Ruminococcus sp.]|nr:AraC family transcriptional regulator [Ruminococcus sp.]MBR6599512.1 AraC family transcriptional regulator [Oscillospiraceae bacterium]